MESPSSPQIIIRKNIETASLEAAELFISSAQTAVKERGLFSAALSGGRTPEAVYRKLAEPSFSKRVDWPRVHLFWGDERCVPSTHIDSNYRMAHETLIAKITIPESNVHRIRGEACPQSADEYEKDIKAFFKLAGGQFPAFDLMLLGLGIDGHTASLFPLSPALDEKERIAATAIAPSGIQGRVTLTPPVIKNSKKIMLLAIGPEKAAIVKQCIEGEFTPKKIPAQITLLSKDETVWILDASAGSLLKNN